MLDLRDYQVSACDDAETFSSSGEQVVVVAPTGAGKTVMLAENARRSLAAGRKVLIGCHREEILGQIASSINRHLGFAPQIISADRTDPMSDVTVAMIPTLTRRHKWIEALRGRDYLLDECHHHVAPGYQRLKEKLQVARMIGYTATPITPTGDGLGRAGFTRMVLGPEPRWLMDNGFLCDYEMWGGKEVDVKDVPIVGGEYSADVMMEKVIPVNGVVVRDWKKYNPDGHRTIAVGVSVEHAEQLATLYQEAGISAVAVSGSTPRTQRKAIFERFRSGEITVLCACAVVDEGLDVPEATCLQLVRAVRSLRLYRQLIGRVLRPSAGKCLLRGTEVLTDKGLVPIECVTIDHKVWDGVEFVSHGGAICNGRKKVITHDGITATPDHFVMTDYGWKTLAWTKACDQRIAVTGSGGQPVWYDKNHQHKNTEQRLRLVSGSAVPVRLDWHGALSQHAEGPSGLPAMCPLSLQGKVSNLALQSLPRPAAAMLQSIICRVAQLWGQGHQVFVSKPTGGSRMDYVKSWLAAGQNVADRQDRQFRPLRAWQSEVGVACGELPQQPAIQARAGKVCQVSQRLSSYQVLRQLSKKIADPDDRLGDSGEVEYAFQQAEGEVWDILDAGPRNRFTANGKLVHNCNAIIIDHGGSWRTLPAPDARIDWSLDDRLRRPKKDIPSDREIEPSTGRIIPAIRVQEARDDLFLIKQGTPQDIIRDKAQRGFRKAVRLYEKGILPTSAMRSQLRMSRYLDEQQLRQLQQICELDDKWLEQQLWLNQAFNSVPA